MYINADSLGNKINELKSLIKKKQYDIIAITEINFSKQNNELDYDSTEWCIVGYDIFKPSKKTFTGRGCLLYVKNSIHAYEIETKDTKYIQYTQVGIKELKGYILVSNLHISKSSGKEYRSDRPIISNINNY